MTLPAEFKKLIQANLTNYSVNWPLAEIQASSSYIPDYSSEILLDDGPINRAKLHVISDHCAPHALYLVRVDY